ncbi:conserved hypothetical protein [Streptomyces sp. SPB074]|nr:conserved hypothetical protein [Streptomyces sp. SPB074]
MTYDTGLVVHGRTSRPHFDPATVRRELAVIRDDLHCDAVQIIGGDPERLELAAAAAAELGLEVWFSPYPLELEAEQILTLFRDCAGRAERLRRQGTAVVFVAGVELSVMNRGFLPGESAEERVGRLMGPPGRRAEVMRELGVRVNAFLHEAAAEVRERFRGGLTYAAIQFEQVDWTPFDIVTYELIRSAEVADRFREAVRVLAQGPKPLAITGFGTAAYRGAGDRGGRVLEVVEHDPHTREPIWLNGVYERDEAGQAAYLSELLEIFDSECVDSAFVFLFALAGYPHRPDGDPRDDLDRAGLGIVKLLEGHRGRTYPGMEWEPKAAFDAVARRYRRRPAGGVRASPVAVGAGRRAAERSAVHSAHRVVHHLLDGLRVEDDAVFALHVQDEAVARGEEVQDLRARDHEVLGVLARVAAQFLQGREHRDDRLLGVVQGQEAGGVAPGAVDLRGGEDLLEVVGGELARRERADRLRERGRGRLGVERGLLLAVRVLLLAVGAGLGLLRGLRGRGVLLLGARVRVVAVHGGKSTEAVRGPGGP